MNWNQRYCSLSYYQITVIFALFVYADTRTPPFLQQVVTSDMEELTKYFPTALEDNNVVGRFCLILKPSIVESLDPVKTALQTAVKDLQQTVVSMQDTIRKRDDEIQALHHEVIVLRAHQDDLEQHIRQASVRVFGVPENIPSSTDEKLLDICNNVMALKPSLSLNDIEVSHRVGKIDSQTSQADDGTVLVANHPIMVKFVSRGTKARVMAARKKLRKLNPENHTPDCWRRWYRRRPSWWRWWHWWWTARREQTAVAARS